MTTPAASSEDPEVKPWEQNPYYLRIARVLVHIQLRLDDELELRELSDVAGLSAFHFHRIFSGMLGETVKAYVRRLRLERAAFLLRYSRQPVIEVALGAGYEAQESFTRAFKSAFGQPPATYRKSQQPQGWIAAPSRSHYQADLHIGDFHPTHSTLAMDIRIESRASQRAICVSHVGPYEQVGSSWEALCAFAGPQGLFGPSTQMLGLSYDDPEITRADRLRYDACMTVEREVEVRGPVTELEIPGGDYAVAMHRGPYTDLKQTYDEIVGRWLPSSGRELRPGPCIEHYLNDPSSAAPEELQTLVHVPLG